MKAPRFIAGLLLGLLLGGTGVLLFEWVAEDPPPQDHLAERAAIDPRDTGSNKEGSPERGEDPRKAVEAVEQREQAGEPGQGIETEEVQVIQVIDGDTFIVKGGETIRILAIDTPERYEPYYDKARDFLKEKILGRVVRLGRCESEPRDRYGRILSFVEIRGRDVGTELLRSGLARTLFIGSCSRKRAPSYRTIERNAFRQARGIWARQEPRRVDHEQAGRYIGWMMSVTGQVSNVHIGPRAIHLNFGRDYRTDFTAVIFRSNLPGLSKQGLLMPVTDYKGKRVQVSGHIKSYNGPEILIDFAEQIKVLR